MKGAIFLHTVIQGGGIRLELTNAGRILRFSRAGSDTDLLSAVLPPVARLTLTDGTEVFPEAVEFDGTFLTEMFPGGYSAKVEICVCAHYLLFTLREVSRTDFYSLAFLSVPVLSDPAAHCGCVATAINCKPGEYPGINRLLQLEAFPKTGCAGAAGAVCAASPDALRGILKEIVLDIPEGAMPVNPLGGPFALDDPGAGANRAYTILPEPLTPGEAAVFADRMLAFGLTQVNLHPGYGMYAHGSFEPNPDVYGDIEGFKKLVKVFHDRGIQVFVHSYTFFIGHNSRYVTPVPHPDLGTVAEFTLAEDLPVDAEAVSVLESTSSVDPHAGYKIPGSAILWIDDELIGFTDTGNRGFSGCTRGFSGCTRGFDGTHPSAHKAGAKVKILLGYFLVLAPRAESPLFYEIARNTAAFYNAIGADGFYLDAIDGVFILGGDDFAWYHSMLFLREMFAHLDHPAVFDCCYGPQYPSTWLLRSRMGVLDAPTRGYRDFIDVHTDYCRANANSRFLVPGMGWKNLYPGEPDITADLNSTGTENRGLIGWQSKLWTPEDVEYLCVKGLALDACLSYHNRFALADRHPILLRYGEIMAKYDALRKTHAFPDGMRAILAAPRSEFHLVSDDPPRFVRRTSTREHFIDAPVAFRNPYGAQAPRIRIEALRTAGAYDAPDAELLCEGADFSGGETKIVRTFPERRDTHGKTAPGAWVEGDGSGATLNIRIRNDFAMKSATSEHFVKLDFTGRRYFAFSESENCERPPEEWPRTELEYRVFTDVERFYDVYGNDVNFSCLDCVEFAVSRPCSAKVSPVVIMHDRMLALEQPCLRTEGCAVTFDTVLRSGTFLEYDPADGSAAVYDLSGHVLCRPAVSGSLTLPAGTSDVVLEAGEHSGNQRRAAVTLIFDDTEPVHEI